MNYYERHIGDYLKDTAHLSLLEHGVYTRLLDVYYIREAPIPDEQAARLVGARTKEEREALQVILQEFFTLTDRGWEQARCEREIVAANEKRSKASASAKQRWAHKQTHSDGNADAQRTHSDGNADGDANAVQTQCEGNALQPPTSNLQGKRGKTPRPRKPQATPLPDDFALSPDLREYATAQLPDSDADALFAKFADQARAKGWTYADWRAAFQTYCRNARKDSGHWSAGQYPRRSLSTGTIHAGVNFS